MNRYDDCDTDKIVKKLTLNYLIKHINNVDTDYLKGLNFLITIDDRFKDKLLKLLVETQKQIK